MGDVHGDEIRNIVGSHHTMPVVIYGGFTGALTQTLLQNAAYVGAGTGGLYKVNIDASLAVPTGPANAPKRWGALACCYLGAPK